MHPIIRTITLGIPIDPFAPEKSQNKIKSFITEARALLEKNSIDARCLRVTCQPMNWLFDVKTNPKQAVKLAQTVENMLDGEAWFCLPGPQFKNANSSVDVLDVIPELLGSTKNVFTNTLISCTDGVHRSAIRKTGQLIKSISCLDESLNANFRFAVMANVASNTPFFPASYHSGKAGFSISLELAETMNQCFSKESDIDSKLALFRKKVDSQLVPVMKLARKLSSTENLEFKGVDFSLAPYPGNTSSATRAVEQLNNTTFGDFDFLFSLFAVNNMLKKGFSNYPQVGFNGTMLSILEDSDLAQHCENGRVDPKDLLLYASVCGCGLDMLPLPQHTSAEQLSSLIEAITSTASKWNKPLIARLLPCQVDVRGFSTFKHDFIVNTIPIPLDKNRFSNIQDVSTFFKHAVPSQNNDDIDQKNDEHQIEFDLVE